MVGDDCFLFDVDGTLTSPRSTIDEEYVSFFRDWVSSNDVFLVSGSDLPKIKEQLPIDILNQCQGIFACMGNELWKSHPNVSWFWNIYTTKLELNDEVYSFLTNVLKKTEWQKHHPPHFEERSGMLNFSIPGRGTNKKLRLDYYNWDTFSGERYTIAKDFNKKFKRLGLEALVGGQTSLDIQKIGKDKSQVINFLNYKKYIFFGDKCDEGGNDYPLYLKCNEKWHVKSPQETFRILRKFYEKN